MAEIFRIMKGDPVDPKHLRYPLWAFPKYNGFRGYVLGGVVYTASNKPFRNTAMQQVYGRPEFEGFDGEFVVGDPADGDNSLNRTSSVVTKKDGDISDLVFYVFDHIENLDAAYRFRYQVADGQCPTHSCVAMTPYHHVESYDQLCRIEADYVSLGWEGLITRDPNAVYKCGRSTAREATMGKLKQFIDDEFEIVGFEERMHNENKATISETGRTKRSSAQAGLVGRGDLGSLLCKTKNGDSFGVGTGFTDAQRAEYWEIRDQLPGQFAKVKYHATGSNTVPVLPVFLQIRPTEDMTQ